MADERPVAFSRMARSLDAYTMKERLKKGSSASKVKLATRPYKSWRWRMGSTQVHPFFHFLNLSRPISMDDDTFDST